MHRRPVTQSDETARQRSWIDTLLTVGARSRTALLTVAAGLAAVGAATPAHAADSQGRPTLLVYPVSTKVTEIAGLHDRDTGNDLLTDLRDNVVSGFDHFKRFNIERAGQQFPDLKEALTSAWVIALQGRPADIQPPPDYAVIPVLTYYRYQQGTETVTVGNTKTTYPTMTVELEANVIYVDFERKTVLAILQAESKGSMRVESSETLQQMIADATYKASDNLADNIVARSRQIEQFRLRPRIDSISMFTGRVGMGHDFGVSEGDYFFFDDGKGSESGWAIITKVDANASDIALLSSAGSGSAKNLVEANKRHWARSYGLMYGGFRNVYSDFTDEDAQTVVGGGNIKPKFGKAMEIGLATMKISQGLPFSDQFDGRWREIWAWDLLYAQGASDQFESGMGFSADFRWGFGYELNVLPFIALSITPYAGIGGVMGFYGAKAKTPDPTSTALMGSEFSSLYGALTVPVGGIIEWGGLGHTVTPYVDAAYDINAVSFATGLDKNHGEGAPNLGGLMLRAGVMYRGNIGY